MTSVNEDPDLTSQIFVQLLNTRAWRVISEINEIVGLQIFDDKSLWWGWVRCSVRHAGRIE